MSRLDLLKDKPQKLFFSYLLPSMCSNVFTSIYVITDTMMVGHGVGKEGLVALNLLLPVFNVFFAFGYMFGVGGSVLMSVAKGRKDEKEASSIFTTALLTLVLIGFALTIGCSLEIRRIAAVLGATNENMELVLEYGRWLMGSGMIYMLVPFFQNFVKNDKDPKRAMIGSVVGSALNMLLDYILIFPMQLGMSGAIIATIIGNVINVVITISHLFTRQNTMKFKISSFQGKYILKVIKNGASSFLTELSVGIVIFVFNIQILSYLGERGIVIYSVISNVAIVVNALLNGVAFSAQPIVSFNMGAGEYDRVKKVRNIGLFTSFIMAALLYGIIFFFTKGCIYAFVTPTWDILEYGIPAIRIYFVGSFALFINVFLANYFQAIVKPVCAFVIGFLRGLVFCVLLVWILPGILGGDIIWWVMPITEVLTAMVSLYFLNNKRLYL
ncbi:MAG: MATE family efflux transporter [Lachnospiraceae bacterium]|nr:MATE family efflux transporter [Lachnospiraceae bacterium]